MSLPPLDFPVPMQRIAGSPYSFLRSGNMRHEIATQTEANKKLEPILEKLSSLAESGDYSDFVIAAGGSEFKVHKCILAMHSPVFDAMFRNDMEESRNNLLKLDDRSEAVVKEMIDFMYSGRLDKSGHPCSLYSIADKYDIEDLRKKTEEIILNDIKRFDAYQIFRFGHQFWNERLKRRAFIEIGLKFPGRVLDEALFEDPQKLGELIEAKANFDAALLNLNVKHVTRDPIVGREAAKVRGSGRVANDYGPAPRRARTWEEFQHYAH